MLTESKMVAINQYAATFDILQMEKKFISVSIWAKNNLFMDAFRLWGFWGSVKLSLTSPFSARGL